MYARVCSPIYPLLLACVTIPPTQTRYLGLSCQLLFIVAIVATRFANWGPNPLSLITDPITVAVIIVAIIVAVELITDRCCCHHHRDIMPAELKFDSLTDGNYMEWKIYMEALLVRKNLLSVIDGNERHPGGKEGTKSIKDFYRKQAEAHAEITLHVTPSQLIYCRDINPYEIWITLANVHLSRGHSTVLALRCRFHHLHLKRNKTMTAYVSHVHYVAFLLEDTGVNISEDDIILAIMARLPHLYDQFLVSLDTLSDSDYTLNVVITRLNNEYQRQCMYSHPPSEPSTDTLRPQTGNEALSTVAPTT